MTLPTIPSNNVVPFPAGQPQLPASISLPLRQSHASVKALLTRLDSSPDEALNPDFADLAAGERALAQFRADLAVEAGLLPAGQGAAVANIHIVFGALDMPMPEDDQHDQWVTLLAEFPAGPFRRATHLLANGGYRYGHRRPRPQDWYDMVQDDLDLIEKMRRDVNDLEKRLALRRQRATWGRSNQETADVRARLERLRQLPDRPDDEAMPLELARPEVPPWVRELWEECRRYPDPADRRSARDMLLYGILRGAGVSKTERQERFPERRRSR